MTENESNQLRAMILAILADENYYGGPQFRVPPLACREAMADGILSDIQDVLEPAK